MTSIPAVTGRLTTAHPMPDTPVGHVLFFMAACTKTILRFTSNARSCIMVAEREKIEDVPRER